MKVKFYGTRGSIPIPEPGFFRYGGNTPCVLITFDDGRIAILDAGTGIRKLGKEMMAAGAQRQDTVFIGLTHTHWDHIQGFPFFTPAYDRERNFTLAISGKDRRFESLEQVFATQMQEEFFPVQLHNMGATMTFWEPSDRRVVTGAGIAIETRPHNHPGGAYGYRIEARGKVLVYCTDVEHGDEIDPGVVELARGADLLIHDAQFTPEELERHRGWGHSSWQQAIEVAERAGARNLALFHHNPDHDDEFLADLEKTCQRRLQSCFMAREGEEIEL